MKRSSSFRDSSSDDELPYTNELQYTTPYGRVTLVFGKSGSGSSELLLEPENGTCLLNLTRKVEPYGGYKGDKFDDGIFDDVRKVFVGEDTHGVVYVKIVYVKDGKDVQREHGRNTGTQTETEFEVNHPEEYITSIWGTCRDEEYRYESDEPIWQDEPIWEEVSQSGSPVPCEDGDRGTSSAVSELQFTTSYGRKSEAFGKSGSGSSEFVLEGKNGTKLVGLCGRSGDFLDAIGAHFVFVSSVFKQLEPVGGSDGVPWDDGVYDCVKKVLVGEDGGCVSSVELEYGKGDQSIVHSHGKKPQERKEFVLDYEHGEYIKSVVGTYNEDGFISSLTFITSKERDLEEFGKAGTTKFVLMTKGFDMIVGFRGRSSLFCVNALGANFAVALAPPIKKLEAKGGDYGHESDWDAWDDGVHDGVHKVVVTYDDTIVHAVKFVYVNGYENERYQTVDGDDHGDIRTIHKMKEGLLWFGNEYITSVEGHFGMKLPLFGPKRSKRIREDCYITMLKFKTNLATHEVLGFDSPEYEYVGERFCLEETDHKIVGFHGMSTSSSLKKLGVYVKPIVNV